ncbi:MAG: GNAT family N-acetyltransferase [Cyanobacteria bacterium J06629_19]
MTVSQITEKTATAAEALGAAFVQDPFMSHVFPNNETRERQLTRLFATVLQCSDRNGGTEVASTKEGALAWISGKNFPLSTVSQIQSGLIWTPFTMGLSAFGRLISHESYCEHQVALRASKGFAYLWVLGIHPCARGKGLAKDLVFSALARMKKEGHSACWVRTDSEKNLSFYQHLGFEKIDSGIAPKSQLPYWLFAKELL